jgi:hypothetical protein
MTIVYADASRAIRVRVVLREAGITSTMRTDVPTEDGPDAAHVVLVTVADNDAAKAVDVLKQWGLMGSVLTPPSADTWAD